MQGTPIRVTQERTPTPVTQERIEYTIEGGIDRGFGIHDVETVLRVDLEEGTAVLDAHQPESDEGGDALGSFHASLAPELRVRVRDAFSRQNLSSLGRSTSGGPGINLHHIRIARGDSVQEVRLTSRDRTVISALDPVIGSLDAVSDFLLQHPVRAVTVGVKARRADNAYLFEIILRNVGTSAVTVPGQAALRTAHEPAHADRWLGVRVASYPPERPGFTAPPLAWSYVGLAARAAERRARRHRAWRRDYCETVAWVLPPPRGRHLVQAVFVSYGNHSDPPGGAPLVRGRALSEAIEIP